MVVFHTLELITHSIEGTKTEAEYGNGVSFTCPDAGPFLVVNATNFTANGFIIENCKESSGNGAIVIKEGSSAIFDNIESSNNYNRAIHVGSHSIVEIKNSYFSNNGRSSLFGGVIFVASNLSLNISNSSFLGNKGYRGGVLYANTNRVLNVTASYFSENHAEYDGGAIYLDSNNNLKVENSTMSQNKAKQGGAIYLDSNNNLNVESSTMSQNKASTGGAICLSSNNTLNVKNLTMSQNKADYGGGAIYLSSNNNLNVENSTMSQNKADVGGAMYLQENNNLTIVNSSLLGNEVIEFGGAISSENNNTAIILTSLFGRNKAGWRGGALMLGSGCQINMTNSCMKDSNARWGGCVYLDTNVVAILSHTRFSSSTALRGGAIFIERDGGLSIYASTFTKNRAEFGGCLFGVSSSIEVRASNFWNNSAFQFGGCFFIKSSVANFEANTFILNQAIKEGGAIHASYETVLRSKKDRVVSNSAPNGGGIALISDSRILCVSGTFQKNTANGGGGVYIESQMTQTIIAQFGKSTFLNNCASQYGGGIAIKTFGSRSFDCNRAIEPCSRVLLMNTVFVGNFANHSGSALLATSPKNVLVSCENPRYFDYTRFAPVSDIMWLKRYWGLVKVINSSSPCESWKDNKLASGAQDQVIGTFGQKINITTNSMGGPQITGDSNLGCSLNNVTSGAPLPPIKITTIDTFGHTPAPTLHSDALVLLNYDGFLNQSVDLSFRRVVFMLNGIVSLVVSGTYMLQLKPTYDNDILQETNLTIVVRNCTINEVSTLGGKLCSMCNEATYNFDLSREGACTPCPVNANCSTRYIEPKDGYWHKSPCHSEVKKCIVEEACNYPNRTEKLTHLTQNFTNCKLTNTSLHEYEENQCNKGYKGRLCGSCKKSYGCAANLQCVKCGPTWVSVLRLLLILLWLFVTTTLTLKGTLPIASRSLARSVAMIPIHEGVNAALLQERTSTQVEEMPQEGASIRVEGMPQEEASTQVGEVTQERASIQVGEVTQERSSAPQVIANDEQLVSSNTSSQLASEVLMATGTLIETWKTLLNFLQVISTVGTMDLQWTSKIARFFNTINLLGSATLNAISGPIDCALASYSGEVRIILMYVIRVFVPVIVIAVVSLYWGYRFLVKYRAERWYFCRRFLLTTITVIYITYFDITQVAVRAFNCVDVYDNSDPFSYSLKRYWVANTSIECYESTHVVLVGTSLVSIIISIGFPLACARALLKNRNDVNVSNSRAHEILGLLCGPFKDQFVYWECITMIKKASLAIIMVFSRTLSGQEQGLLISIVIVFFLAFHSACFPFKREFNILNYYEIGSLMTSGITYILVQFLNDEISEIEQILVFVALVILVGGFIMIMGLIIARSLIAVAKVSLKYYGIIDVHDEIGWLETIKIYSSSWWYGRFSSTHH